MYNKRTMMGLMAMAAAFDGFGHGRGHTRAVKQSEPKPPKPIGEVNKKMGLSEFEYGENKLWALNQKNADKKAKKLGWI